jgi:hypothetical protein
VGPGGPWHTLSQAHREPHPAIRSPVQPTPDVPTSPVLSSVRLIGFLFPVPGECAMCGCSSVPGGWRMATGVLQGCNSILASCSLGRLLDRLQSLRSCKGCKSATHLARSSRLQATTSCNDILQGLHATPMAYCLRSLTLARRCPSQRTGTQEHRARLIHG